MLLLSAARGFFLVRFSGFPKCNHPTINNTPKTIDTSTTGTTIAITFDFFFFVLIGVDDVVVVVIGAKGVAEAGVTMQHFSLYPQNFS